jgi:hypothetical protein
LLQKRAGHRHDRVFEPNKVVLALIGDDGMPDLALPAYVDEVPRLQGAGRELVTLIWPGASWTAIGDPPKHVELAT